MYKKIKKNICIAKNMFAYLIIQNIYGLCSLFKRDATIN
jgi:hypothetical protein